MNDTLSVSGYLITHMADVLGEAGRDPKPLLDELEINLSEITGPDARVPLNRAVRFWNGAQDLSGEPLFGLKIASALGKGYPTLRYALQNSATLGDAYVRWARFYGLISDHGVQEISRENGGAVMRCDRRVDETMPAVLEDWMVGQWLTLGRRLVDESWTPRQVQFEHEGAGEETRYQEWFGAPVVFGADHSEIRFTSDILDLPVVGADPDLSKVLDRHIENVLAKRPALETFADRVRDVMAKSLNSGEANPAAIASALNISERTLQRRLRDEGATTTEILNQLRRDLAGRYLGDPAISITETAFLLGFSEPSAFHRAFKRWTGVTPAEFRKKRTG